jgi:hypothetical protein
VIHGIGLAKEVIRRIGRDEGAPLR